MTETAGSRDTSLDVARGVAIILVVLGHSLRGLVAGGVVPQRSLAWLDTWLYLTHLPVFAFAVGVLTPASVARAGTRTYLGRRLGLLAWLYLVWTLLEGAVEVLSTPWKNVPVGWADVLTLWRPIGHLWFLPHLAVATVVLLGVAPWRPGVRAVLGSAAVTVVALAAWGWDPGYAGLQGLALVPCYVAGAAIGHPRLRAVASRAPSALLAVGGLLLTAVVGLGAVWFGPTTPTTQSVRTVPSVALGVVLVAVALVGTISLAVVASRWPRASGWVAYVGRQSLPVYLGHIVVTAGTRVLLLRAGVTAPAVHLVLSATLGVSLPLLLERATRAVPYLFVPPWQVRRGPASAAR